MKMKNIAIAIAAILCTGAVYATATFVPLNPVPQETQVTPSSVAPGSTATLSYSAALASTCSVTQQGCSGAQPSIPAAGCNGQGAQSNCSASVTVTVPSTATTCTDTISVTCQPGSVVSSATLNITASPPPGNAAPTQPPQQHVREDHSNTVSPSMLTSTPQPAH